MTAKGDFRKLRRDAEKQDWRVEQRKSGHWILYAPDGINRVIMSGTPGTQGEIDHARRLMKRYGFREDRR